MWAEKQMLVSALVSVHYCYTPIDITTTTTVLLLRHTYLYYYNFTLLHYTCIYTTLVSTTKQ